MARMVGADWQGEHGGTLMSEASLNKVCIHTIVGRAPAHAAHFSTRWDGYLYQSRDTRYRSAANLYGNDDVIAVENEDVGFAYGSWNTQDGHAVPGFTAAQLETIAKVCAWTYEVHGIPLVLCPDSCDGSQGIAYHRQGCDGNYTGYAYDGRVAGGELWSTAYGKVCPGDRRITQLVQVIIPRARVIAGLEEGDDVSVEDIEKMMWRGGGVAGTVEEGTLIDDVREVQRMLWVGGAVEGTTDPNSLIGKVRTVETEVEELQAKADAIDVKLDQIIALLEEPPPPTGA